MDTIPFARPGSVFERINDLAAYAQLTPQEQYEYDQDLQVYRDYKNTISYAENQAEARGEAKGIAKGMATGMAKGMEKGMAKGRCDMISQMIQNGMPIDMIARYTNFTVEKIKDILNTKGE